MFSSGPNYSKLKTNLRLAVNRLKLLEKKKTELALKARKEIADYISDGKIERARIRVEHIIREDYQVEAFEIVEMLADLVLARFGLVQQMKELDEGLAEAISRLIWSAPRLQADVPELKIIGDALISKYGKPYGMACHDNAVGTVSPKLMLKMSVHAPPKILVEKYLIEIAKIYNVDYEPDPKIMEQDEDGMLIDIGGENNLGGEFPPGHPGGASGGGGGGAVMGMPVNSPGFIGYPYMPMPPAPTGQHPMNPPAYQPFQYPSVPTEDKFMEDKFTPPPKTHQNTPKFPPNNLPPNISNDTNNSDPKELNTDFPKPKPAPRGKAQPGGGKNESFPDFPDLPDLPAVPSNNPSDHLNFGGSNGKKPNENDIDFDDLTKRFEDLKKRK